MHLSEKCLSAFGGRHRVHVHLGRHVLAASLGSPRHYAPWVSHTMYRIISAYSIIALYSITTLAF